MSRLFSKDQNNHIFSEKYFIANSDSKLKANFINCVPTLLFYNGRFCAKCDNFLAGTMLLCHVAVFVKAVFIVNVAIILKNMTRNYCKEIEIYVTIVRLNAVDIKYKKIIDSRQEQLNIIKKC